MSVDSGKVSISANYYFKNYSNEAKSALIFYPFPIDEFHSYPDSIDVVGLKYTKTDSGINFVIHFKPIVIETLRVFYRQRLNDNQARYILTTTQNWQRPLKEARFVIDFSENLAEPKFLYFSYKADSLIKRDNRIFYYLYKKNFMPKTDLIAVWH
jgi:hypothetical protein